MRAEPVTKFVISPHAAFEMKRRGLAAQLVHDILTAPEQREEIRPGRAVLQVRHYRGRPEKVYLVRVFVDVDRETCGSRNRVSHQQALEILEGRAVKVSYDPKADTLSIVFKEDTPVAESDEEKPGVILDYDKQDNLIAMEILDASRRVTDASKVDYRTVD